MNHDPSLNDDELEDEIHLVGDLVLAAAQSEGRLSEDAIDEALGIDPQEGSPTPPSSSDS